MACIGNFDDIDNPEQNNSTKRIEAPVPTEQDKNKLERSNNVSKPLENMSDKEKADYYRSKGWDSLADNRESIINQNEGKGLSDSPAKLNSHNYDKLMGTRGLDNSNAKDIKESFSKWNPDAKENPYLRNDNVTVRHASPGEEVTMTHNKGEKPSGVFVSKESLGKTPKERIDKGALPSSNRAEVESKGYLAKPQDVIEGCIAPQKKFEGDGIPRSGGGRQMVTDGGYREGAVSDKKPKNI